MPVRRGGQALHKPKPCSHTGSQEQNPLISLRIIIGRGVRVCPFRQSLSLRYGQVRAEWQSGGRKATLKTMEMFF